MRRCCLIILAHCPRVLFLAFSLHMIVVMSGSVPVESWRAVWLPAIHDWCTLLSWCPRFSPRKNASLNDSLALLGFSGACCRILSRFSLFLLVATNVSTSALYFSCFCFYFPPSYILLSCASWFIRLKWRLRRSKNLRVYPVREARCSTAM